MKLKWKRILSLALLALLLACAVNLPLPGQFPAVARAKGPFVIDADGVLVEYTGRGGIVRIPRGVTARLTHELRL